MGFLLVTAVCRDVRAARATCTAASRSTTSASWSSPGVDRPLPRPVPRRRRRALADPLAGRPGRRRRDAVRQLHGDPHRRVPVRPARARARHQPGRRDRRLVPRPRARRPARGVATGARCSGSASPRRPRHRLVIHAPCTTSASTTKGRLDWPGQHHLRPRPQPRCWPRITYGIQPYGGHPMGWTNPWVLAGLIGGAALLVAFCVVEATVPGPDVPPATCSGSGPSALGNLAGLLACDRPRRPAVHADHLAAGHLAAAARLQLREHAAVGRHLPAAADASASSSPGPVSGWLSDRFGARPFAVGGLLAGRRRRSWRSLLLPTDFPYWLFALLIALNGIGSGLFSAPNTTAIMNSVPAAPARRGRPACAARSSTPARRCPSASSSR